MSDDLTPLPTLDQVRKIYRLNRPDAQLKLDQLNKERNSLLAQRAAQQSEALRTSTEATRIQADAEVKRAAAASETERLRQQGLSDEAKRSADSERTARENSPYNQGRQIVQNIGAPLAGYAVGHGMGAASDARMTSVEAQRAENLNKLMTGSSKLSSSSAKDIALAKAKVAAARQQGLTAGRGVGQYATPAALLLAGTGTIAGSNYLDNEYAKDAGQAFGRGEQLAGVGMGLKQGYATMHRPDPLNSNAVAGLARLEQFPDKPAPKGKAAPKGKTPEKAKAAAPKSAPLVAAQSKAVAEEGAAAIPNALRPKLAAGDLEGKTATELKEMYRQRNPGEKLPVAKSGVGGLRNALVEKLTTTGGLAGLAIGSTVYDALRHPAEAEDGSTSREPMGAVPAALAGAGAGYGAYKGVNAVGKALDIAGQTAAPYVEKALGPLAPYAGRAAGLVGNVASKVATPLAVGQLGYAALAPSDTAKDDRLPISANSAAEAPQDQQSFVQRPEFQNAKPYDPSAIENEHHLADEAINALSQRPEAMGAIIQRTHEIAQNRGWDPSVIGKIIGMKMQQSEGIGAQQ